jgi:hypothetical protein
MEGESKRLEEDLKMIKEKLLACEESISTSHGPQILLILDKWLLLREKSALEEKIGSTRHKREILAKSIQALGQES